MPARGGASGIHNEDYSVNNLIGADPLYVGKVRPNGVWLMLRYRPSAGVLDWANLSNNVGVVLYADAWTARAALTYAAFETLDGV